MFFSIFFLIGNKINHIQYGEINKIVYSKNYDFFEKFLKNSGSRGIRYVVWSYFRPTLFVNLSDLAKLRNLPYD